MDTGNESNLETAVALIKLLLWEVLSLLEEGKLLESIKTLARQPIGLIACSTNELETKDEERRTEIDEHRVLLKKRLKLPIGLS
jgi:hypothetical protein